MKAQVPFTGRSGRVLDTAFEIAGVKKSDVFITNVVHCHTPSNRKSLPHEIANCRGFLLEELKLVKPKVVIPLGQDAVVSIIGKDAWPSSVGKRVIFDHYSVYPMYHPSYLLRKGTGDVRLYVNSLASILKQNL
jgi:DNA polymerase